MVNTFRLLGLMPAFFCLLLLFVTPESVDAASFRVQPVRIHLDARQPVATLRIANAGTETTVVDIAAFRWHQTADGDQLTPTNNLLVSPLIARLPPGERQLVRVGIANPPDDAREHSFRLLIREVPQDRDPGSVGIALQLSVPVFFQTGGPASPMLEWELRHDNGDSYIVARNHGTRHLRVTGVTLMGQGQRYAASLGSSTHYVLPGGRQRWFLSSPLDTDDISTLQVIADTASGRRRYPISGPP